MNAFAALCALIFRRLCETARLMVGQPDYDRYEAHCRSAHPDRPVMDRASFFRERQERRYAGRGAGRCC